MPLSKKRDRERKQLERAKTRLDRQLCPSHQSNSVQPKPPDGFEIIAMPPGIRYSFTDTPDIDADGNIIPEY